MNIIFCSPLLSYPGGHFIRQVVERTNSMRKAGLNVTILGFPSNDSGALFDKEFAYVSLRDNLPPFLRKIADKLSRVYGKGWVCTFEHMWVVWYAIKYAKKNNIPLVYISDLEPWIIVALAMLGQIRKSPRIAGMIPHPFYTKGAKLKNIYRTIRSQLDRISLPWLPRFIDVICYEEFSAKSMFKSTDNIHIISDGFVRIDEPILTADARRRLGLPIDRRILLFFGADSSSRGAELLAAAMKHVKPEFYVCVIGAIGRLFKQAFFTNNDESEQAWHDHLRIVDHFVSENERKLYYQSCDAVALPHRYGFTCSTGNLRDAISYGKAVIATDQFYMGHTVKSNDLGLTFPPENIDKLKECLESFARMPDAWYAGISIRAKAIVEANPFDAIGLRYKNLFEAIVAPT